MDVIQESEQVQPVVSQCSANSSAEQSTSLKQLLKSTPNRLVQTRNFQRMQKTTPIENVIKLIRDMANFTFFPVSQGTLYIYIYTLTLLGKNAQFHLSSSARNEENAGFTDLHL